jgi:hypothetical protein
MACGALYIIGKLLERRCLKLLIWTSETQVTAKRRAGSQNRESDCQFDSRPEKVGNRPDLLGCRQRATYHWKALNESYNFALDCVAIRGLLAKVCGFKVAGVLAGAVSGLPRGSHAGVTRESRESRDKKAISMWASWRGAEYTIGSKVVAYSRGPGRGESCVKVPVACPQHPRVSRNVN